MDVFEHFWQDRPLFSDILISWHPVGHFTFYSRSGIDSSEVSLLGSPGVSVFSDFASWNFWKFVLYVALNSSSGDCIVFKILFCKIAAEFILSLDATRLFFLQ